MKRNSFFIQQGRLSEAIPIVVERIEEKNFGLDVPGLEAIPATDKHPAMFRLSTGTQLHPITYELKLKSGRDVYEGTMLTRRLRVPSVDDTASFKVIRKPALPPCAADLTAKQCADFLDVARSVIEVHANCPRATIEYSGLALRRLEGFTHSVFLEIPRGGDKRTIVVLEAHGYEWFRPLQKLDADSLEQLLGEASAAVDLARDELEARDAACRATLTEAARRVDAIHARVHLATKGRRFWFAPPDDYRVRGWAFDLVATTKKGGRQ